MKWRAMRGNVFIFLDPVSATQRCALHCARDERSSDVTQNVTDLSVWVVMGGAGSPERQACKALFQAKGGLAAGRRPYKSRKTYPHPFLCSYSHPQSGHGEAVSADRSLLVRIAACMALHQSSAARRYGRAARHAGACALLFPGKSAVGETLRRRPVTVGPAAPEGVWSNIPRNVRIPPLTPQIPV